jgi:hypothetical protein
LHEYFTNSEDASVLKMLFHLLAFLNGGQNYNHWKLCLLGLSYLYHFGVDLFRFELTIDVQCRYSFRNGSSSRENHGVFEEGGEFSLTLVASEGGSHTDDCVLVEDEDCRGESSINELNFVSKEERINFINEENSIDGNLSHEDVGISAVVDVGLVSEEVISNLAGPWRVLLLLNSCEYFIGNHHHHLLGMKEVEITS